MIDYTSFYYKLVITCYHKAHVPIDDYMVTYEGSHRTAITDILTKMYIFILGWPQPKLTSYLSRTSTMLISMKCGKYESFLPTYNTCHLSQFTS